MKYLGRVDQMRLFRCWMVGVKRKHQATIPDASNSSMRIQQAISQAASHFSGQLVLNEQLEKARAFRTVSLLQESILQPEEEEDYSTGLTHQRPVSPLEYTLDIDYTAAKVVEAVTAKVKLFQCESALYKGGSHDLLSSLEGLHDILLVIQGNTCLKRYKEVLEEVLLYATKAFAFMEKVFLQAMPNSIHGVVGHKTHAKFCEFACQFYNQKVKLCEQDEGRASDVMLCDSTRKARLSFGVTTYLVPIPNIAGRLYKKKRLVVPVADVDGESTFKVELSYPRTWLSDDVGLVSRVEGNDRGYNQILQAERVKIEKGGWGWEAAQHTVLITYDDLLVANVASMAGSLLTFNKACVKSKKVCGTQTYRTSVQIVGSSRIDLDLQNLFIKGTKDRDHVYYKCFANTDGEEILAIYRYHRNHFHKAEGLLHIVGRGNQPGLRHVLVSIFSSLGFSSAV